MTRKLTAVLLIVGLLFSNIASTSLHSGPSFAYDLGAMADYINKNFPDKADYNDAQIYTKAEMGNMYESENGNYRVNTAILKKHGKAVYTTRENDHYDYTGHGPEMKDENGVWQSQYLGYTWDEKVQVTNPLYPNLTGTTDFYETHTSKQWITENSDEAKRSWDPVNTTVGEYMLRYGRTRVQDGGMVTATHSLSIEEVLKDEVSAGDVDGLKAYAKHLTTSTLKNWGSVQLWHRIPATGNTYYRTVDIETIPFGERVLTLTPDDNLIEYRSDELVRMFGVTATLTIENFEPLGNWGLGDYLQYADITVNGQTQRAYVENEKLSAHFTFEVPRSHFKTGDWDSYLYDGDAHIISTDLFNQEEFKAEGDALTAVMVEAGEVEPAFTIMNGEIDVTDDVIEYTEWADLNLNLVPNNQVFGNNSITSVAWALEGPSATETKAGNSTVFYAMTEPKLATHTAGGLATFAMTIQTEHPFDYGAMKGLKQITIRHTVLLKQVEEIVDNSLKEPVAKLRSPRTVRLGQPFTLKGNQSYDPDGDIVDYDFRAVALEKIKPLRDDGSIIKAVFLQRSASKFTLEVTDNDGLTDTDVNEVELLDPLEARMRFDGIRKENRKVTLNGETSIDTKYFPINSYTWSIVPLEGQAPSSIKYDTGNQGEVIDVLFKESGAYEVTLDIRAQCTYPGDEDQMASDSATFPIYIQEDQAPIAELSSYSITMRDRMDGGQATIEVADLSYSHDNDDFTVEWFYTFDSDNDGSIADESWLSMGSGLNLDSVKVDKVGDYYFYNKVTEVIPENETISRFLTPADYRSDDSLDQNLFQRHCLVENVTPVITTSVDLEKSIDLLVFTDEDGQNYTSLMSEVNRLQINLYERKIGLNEKIVKLKDESVPKASVGMKKEQYFNWHRNWYVNPEWALYRKYDSWRDTNIKILPYAPKIKGGVVETKTGTITDMISFPTYPQAYGEFAGQPYIEYYKSPSSGSHNYYLRNLDVLVYNQPYDYLGRFNYSGNFYVAESMYDDKFTARFNNTSLINVNSFNDMRANPQFMDILYPNVINPSVDSGWTQGSLVSETDVEFIVPMIESYVNAYSGSENDKYLILAIADGRNVYLPDSLKQKIVDEYGFKVYFSIDEFWGEFTPKVPSVVDVKLQDGALYALTEYGNQLENYNGTVIDTVYFKYQDRSENPVDYENNLEGFVRVDARTTGAFELADINGYREGLPYVRPWTNAYDNNSYKWYDPNGNRQYADIEHRYYIGQSIWDSAVKTSYEIGSTWTLPSGALEVSKLYSISNQSGLVETQAGELYFVGNNVTSNATTGHQKAVKLSMNGIESVYAMNAVNKQYGMTMQLTDSASYSNYEYRMYHGLADVIDTLYLVKDLDGKYALLHTYQPRGSLRNGYIMYTPRPTMRIYYMDDLNQFELTETQLPMDPDTFNLFDRTNPHGILQSGIPWGTSLADEETRDAIASFLWNYMEHDPVTVTRWILADNSGNLYVNGEKMAVNASVPTLRFGERDETLVYVDTNGEVYGKGQSEHGELGRFGVIGSFIKVFNSPYTLNATYNTSDFASVFDFTSQSPAYQVVNRGLYSNIMAMILGEYDGYGTTETILIEVGDTVDVSGTVLDYEGDPIYDKRIDAVHDHTYFDNSEGSFIPPENFDQAIVIDKPGRMELRVRAQDNPVGSDERFAQYRYWNKDKTVIEVIAHRKPFAVLGVALVPQIDGTFNFVGSDNGSYDLDHSVSRADKGIVEKRYYYRKDLQPTWTEFNGTLPIENGVDYQIALRVKDLEGAWSDYDIVDIRIDGEPFILNASITPPYPTGIPAGDTVTLDATVFSYKAIESVTADVNGVVVPLIRQSLSGMESVYQATYKLPETLADKDYYDVLVTAKAADGSLRLAPLKLNVSTPISLVGDVSPYSIKKGQTGTITAKTSLYAESCEVSLFHDLYGGTASEIVIPLSKASISGEVQHWTASHTFDEDVPEGVYKALFTAVTANGKSAVSLDTFEFIPNQPPRAEIVSIAPVAVYEGDDVRIGVRVYDPDNDPITLTLEAKRENEENWFEIISEETLASGQSLEGVLEGVSEGTYSVRAIAVDPMGETGQDAAQFEAGLLSVRGTVDHTNEWNENRKAYNESKSGQPEMPRPNRMFWPGERLVLRAETTELSTDAEVTCLQVTAEVLDLPYQTTLSAGADIRSRHLWEGELWDQDMLAWTARRLVVRFTAVYSNGTIKVHDVAIDIDDSEDYWRYHRKF